MDKHILKVLMISNLPVDYSNIRGGVESAVINLLTGFSKLKIDVQLVNFPTTNKHQPSTNFSENISSLFISTGLTSNYIYNYLFHGRREIKKIIKNYRPDLIHIQGTGPQLLLLNKKELKNAIVTQHGIMKEERKHQIGIKKSLKFFLKSVIETKYLPMVKNIIFISDYSKIFSTTDGLINSTKIPNAINDEFFHLDRLKINLNKIIYVGAINKRKGLINILTALQILKNRGKNFNLDIIGDFTDSAYEALIKNYLNSHSISDNVTSYGWQPPNSIIDIMKDNSLFILASYQETLPVSIAEAMAAGLVVIANDVGGISEMFIDNQSGFLFKNNNINDLVQILEKLYNNSNMVDEISKNANSFAKIHYKLDTIAQQTFNFYTRVSKSSLRLKL